MQRKNNGTVTYYTFDSLDSCDVLHAISTRHGGVSPVPFATLNLSRHVGDEAASVDENLRRLHTAIGLEITATVDASQAHADQVALVSAEQHGTRIQQVDALITNTPNMPLLLRFADCVPILFFDPAQRAIGVAHAGWRGTVMQIATKTAQSMFNMFGTRPRDLIACIAPSIGPCCYRVGDEVIAHTRAAFQNADELLIPQADGGIHFDLWQANASQLRALGVEHIESANICTAHHTDDFYSWRAEESNTGRFGAIIAMTNGEWQTANGE